MKILAVSQLMPGATPVALQERMTAEIEHGAQSYLDGFIEQAYLDTDYIRAYLIVEAPSEQAAQDRLARYPNVAAGLICFTTTPLVGMPAIELAEREGGNPPPPWWP